MLKSESEMREYFATMSFNDLCFSYSTMTEFIPDNAHPVKDSRESTSTEVSLKQASDADTESSEPSFFFENHMASSRICPFCGKQSIVKNGHKNHKQRYLCRSCGKSVVGTTGTIMANSHQSTDNWTIVINDTISNVAALKTAEKLGISEQTVLNMRHKIMLGIQKMDILDPVILGNISELDETYVLESNKGTKCTDREPRKRGESASKPGLSNEQVCICTGVERHQGPVMFQSVNRATPSAAEIHEVFDGHIADDSVVFVDGQKSYNGLNETMNIELVNAKKDPDKNSHLNNVNSSHSYYKSVYQHMRGVATKYINRYNALLAHTFRSPEGLADYLFARLCSLRNDTGTFTIRDVRKKDLLYI